MLARVGQRIVVTATGLGLVLAALAWNNVNPGGLGYLDIESPGPRPVEDLVSVTGPVWPGTTTSVHTTADSVDVQRRWLSLLEARVVFRSESGRWRLASAQFSGPADLAQNVVLVVIPLALIALFWLWPGRPRSAASSSP